MRVSRGVCRSRRASNSESNTVWGSRGRKMPLLPWVNWRETGNSRMWVWRWQCFGSRRERFIVCPLIPFRKSCGIGSFEVREGGRNCFLLLQLQPVAPFFVFSFFFFLKPKRFFFFNLNPSRWMHANTHPTALFRLLHDTGNFMPCIEAAAL